MRLLRAADIPVDRAYPIRDFFQHLEKLRRKNFFMIIAEVCVNLTANSIDQNFTYRVPERLKFLSAGWRVQIPFGAQKVDGFVM
ncbi:MAG: hypothetical protein IJS69_04025, partial [Selenomonadaceae bacterium]|nr:hypothetical protein [Selenomonadaceae bacterium]